MTRSCSAFPETNNDWRRSSVHNRNGTPCGPCGEGVAALLVFDVHHPLLQALTGEPRRLATFHAVRRLLGTTAAISCWRRSSFPPSAECRTPPSLFATLHTKRRLLGATNQKVSGISCCRCSPFPPSRVQRRTSSSVICQVVRR